MALQPNGGGFESPIDIINNFAENSELSYVHLITYCVPSVFWTVGYLFWTILWERQGK